MNFQTIETLINSIHISASTAQFIIWSIVIIIALNTAWKTWNTLSGK